MSSHKKKERSHQLLLDVMDEDWVRLEGSFPSLMTYRDNTLVNDLTMNGTLFKLWESIRLDPNEENVSHMLKYLETLLHLSGKEFEEVYYYENLFESLLVNQTREYLLKIKDIIMAKRKYRESTIEQLPRFSVYK